MNSANTVEDQGVPVPSGWRIDCDAPAPGEVPIPPETTLVVGRDKGCDVVIDHLYVSRKHATLSNQNGTLVVEDLQSTQGTRVNEQRITQPTILQAGDRIRFAAVDCLVEQISAVGQQEEDADQTMMGEATIMEPSPVPAAPPPPRKGPVQSDDQRAPSPGPERAPASSQPPSEADQDSGKPRDWWDAGGAGMEGTQRHTAVPQEQVIEPVEVRTDHPILLALDGAQQWQRFPLRAGQTTIGRGEEADIRLDEVHVSTTHAQIVGEGGRWKVVNLLATNSTLVNGQKVQSAYLRPGDVIQLGNIHLQFALPEKGGSKATRGDTGSLPRLFAGGFLLTLVLLGVAYLVWEYLLQP